MLACATVGGAVCLGYLVVKSMYPWLLEDLSYMKKGIPPTIQFLRWLKKEQFLIEIFEENVAAHPDKVHVLFEDKKFTYKVGV